MTQFKRTAKVTIGTPGTGGLVVEDLRIVFNVQKTDSKNPNTARIEIHNLSKKSRDRIVVPDADDEANRQLVYLSAGYAEGAGNENLFIGNITEVYHVVNPPTVMSVIEATDGEKEILEKKISLSYQAGTSGRTVLEKVLSAFSIGNDLSNLVFTDKKYANGFSFAGPAENALTKVTEFLELEWSIQDNEIKLIPFDGNDTARAVLISPQTGLLNSPERLQGKTRKAKGKTKKITPGWKITSLLQPKILPGNQVSLKSSIVEENSFFKVSNVSHNGDTHGSDFITITEVRE